MALPDHAIFQMPVPELETPSAIWQKVSSRTTLPESADSLESDWRRAACDLLQQLSVEFVEGSQTCHSTIPCDARHHESHWALGWFFGRPLDLPSEVDVRRGGKQQAPVSPMASPGTTGGWHQGSNTAADELKAWRAADMQCSAVRAGAPTSLRRQRPSAVKLAISISYALSDPVHSRYCQKHEDIPVQAEMSGGMRSGCPFRR